MPTISSRARTLWGSQVEGSVLVFAATGDEALDRVVVTAARERKIPANAVDQPDYCDFLTPALVNRAPVAVAIGTEGAGPVLAQMIRAQIDQLLSPSLGIVASLAASYRDAVDRLVPRGVARRVLWRRFFSGPVADQVALGDLASARREASKLLDVAGGVAGHVWLVGAGPGAEDLLTLRAQRVMMEADAIVYDALVPQAIVDMGRRDAERLSVGKRKGCHTKSQDEINQLLVKLAGEGKRVVRLKSGDPLVYGRAGEEMAALREAGISYEVVPGITSAFAAAADFELPLTLRGVASSLVFTTGHDLTGSVLPDWARLAFPARRLPSIWAAPLRPPSPRGSCRPVCRRHDRRGDRECEPCRAPSPARNAPRSAGPRGPHGTGRAGHGDHRRSGCGREFRAVRAAGGRPHQV